MKRREHSSWQVLADVMTLMFASLVIMVSLLMISTKVATQVKTPGIKPKAEYLVTLTWDDKRDVDLDLWLQGPLGHVIWYNGREAQNISLDRDSRGFSTNRQMMPNGSLAFSGNQEVITIRAVIPGDYLVAVGYYSGIDVQAKVSYSFDPPDPRAPIDATVQVEKINPDLSLVAGQSIHLVRVKQSMNVVAFHVADDGSVTILPTPPGSLIADHGGMGAH